MIKILAIVGLIFHQVSAFVTFKSGNLGVTTASSSSGTTSILTTPMEYNSLLSRAKCKHMFLLMAERRRRKRKDGSSYSPSFTNDENNQDLPEFDLIEEDPDPLLESNYESSSSSLPTKTSNKSTASFNINDPNVKEAMMSSNTSNAQGLLSTKDLIRSRNRELEQKLVNNNDITENVPSLAEYTQNKLSNDKGTNASIGKKAARREERVSAALEAKKLQDGTEMGGGFLNGFSFGKDKDGNPKTPIKLLEEGTWACIWALIAWEVYINSPFFERQGSMPPIVFQEVSELFFM